MLILRIASLLCTLARGNSRSALRDRQFLEFSGAPDMPRKPNYDFERRERERSKAAESAKKAQAKADKKASEQGTPGAETP